MTHPLHAKYGTVASTELTRSVSLIDAYNELANPVAGLLARTSTDVKGQKQSVTQQVNQGRRYAEKYGAQLPEANIWTDSDASASRYAKHDKRESLPAAVAAVKAGAINLLIMKEVSRSVRQDAHWLELKAACRDHGVILCIGGSLYDLTNPDHALALDIAAAVSQGETHRTSVRIDGNRRGAVLDGRPLGRLAYGYLREYNHKGALVRVVEHPDEGPIIREIFCRVAHRREIRQRIAGDLNRRGVPTPAESQRSAPFGPDEKKPKWWAASIRQLVTNPRYLGLYVWRNQIVEGVVPWWPPLVTDEGECQVCGAPMAGTWRAAQEMGKAPPYEVRSTIKSWVVGLLECGVCTAQLRRSSTAHYNRRMRCEGMPGGPAGCTSIKLELVETMIRALVIAVLSDPRLGDWFGFGDEERAAASLAAGEIEEAESEIRALAGRVEAGEVSLMLAAAEEKRLRGVIAELEPRAQVRIPHPLVGEVAGPDPVAVGAAFDSLDLVQRRDLVRALLLPGKRIRLLPLADAGKKRHDVGDPYRSLEVPWLGA